MSPVKAALAIPRAWGLKTLKGSTYSTMSTAQRHAPAVNAAKARILTLLATAKGTLNWRNHRGSTGGVVRFGHATDCHREDRPLLDRCVVFRGNGWLLRDKVGSVLAVGGVRHGGQELTLQAVRAAMMGA